MYPVRSSRPLATLASLFLAVPLALSAQSAPPCTAADLDITLRFGNYAPSTYIVAAFSTNVANHACLLDAHALPEFDTYNPQTHLDLEIHLQPAASRPITLAPGDSAHQTVRWSTTAPADAPPCVKASVMTLPVNTDAAHPLQIVSPSLLPPVCSQVAFESYATGPLFGDDDLAPVRPAEHALRLSSSIFVYHPGESFVLHAESPLERTEARQRPRCPSYFLRQRAPDGSTRLEEYDQREFRCGFHAEMDQTPVLDATFDAVPPIQPNLLGHTSLQIFQLSGKLTDPRIAFTASNVLKIRIAPEKAPGEAESPTYDDWKETFVLTDTSFGKQSALLDQETHLEWLRLSATRNKNEETLRRNMNPKKALDGWRFATADEVLLMFEHFTEAPGGRSTDPKVVQALMDVMGGPLGHSKNTMIGFERYYTNGRIAGYEAPTSDFGPASGTRFRYRMAYLQEESDAQKGDTALADPSRFGWTDGDRTNPDTGFFLVREHN